VRVLSDGSGAHQCARLGERDGGRHRARCVARGDAEYGQGGISINAMGISKAMMEKFMVAKARMQNAGETVLCATRYGNVMASRGSVIPLFVSQLKEGKPLTVTDPNMTRS